MAGPGLGATGAAGGVAPTGMEPAGRYDQAFCARKMQAEDMKNAKQFLQMGPLSTATIEQFDQWRDNITRAARLINLMEQAHWATINRLIETRMDNNIHQAVKDLIPEGRRDLEALNPDNLLDRIKERLITVDQLKY